MILKRCGVAAAMVKGNTQVMLPKENTADTKACVCACFLFPVGRSHIRDDNVLARFLSPLSIFFVPSFFLLFWRVLLTPWLLYKPRQHRRLKSYASEQAMPPADSSQTKAGDSSCSYAWVTAAVVAASSLTASPSSFRAAFRTSAKRVAPTTASWARTGRRDALRWSCSSENQGLFTGVSQVAPPTRIHAQNTQEHFQIRELERQENTKVISCLGLV